MLKAKAITCIATLALITVLVLAGCGGGVATTSQSTTPTTSKPPTTTTTIPATTTSVPATTGTVLPTTSAGGQQLPLAPNPLTNVNHDTAAKLNALKGLCLMMCHGPGTPNAVPVPPTWDGTKNGSASHPGVYTVVPGSPQDHTGRTDDLCNTQPGCHAFPGAATTAPATTSAGTTKPATTAPGNTTSATAAAPVLTGKVNIDVTSGGFSYKVVTIAVGTRVVWNNPDHEDHAVISDSTGVDGFEIGGGATVETDFTKAGVYKLHLEEAPNSTITITVV
jgi:plastocyanin